ncbi:FAD/NAD(P)-binding domain-containing protein [Polyporus arcularius HHB13444]|uniref:FAD/NAD(P)-binding domain-containing protein n=1 Tax=Polyporus arcularius HHB13444 TaxID=1314778 RepID=A0A5C3PE44_9APHY|nr:FAD/NAD(P)-binding domain-containing protein [Polyporus arcularius HHB13444]
MSDDELSGSGARPAPSPATLALSASRVPDMQEETTTPPQTSFPITFVIVGGGIAGLSCALALRRVGHRVTVLERLERDTARGEHGVRAPPNLSKILFHWGLRDVLMSKASLMDKLVFMRYDSSETLAEQLWDAEMLKETQGLFLMLSRADLYDILYDAAIKLGADVRFNSEVAEVDPQSRAVRLSSGERISGDVLIGADGALGQCRTAVLGRRDPGSPTGLAVYDTLISLAYVSTFDPRVALKSWQCLALGGGRAAVAYPIRGFEDISFQLYAPDDAGASGCYEDAAPADLALVTKGSGISDHLRKTVLGARKTKVIPIRQHVDLEDWVSDDGRLLLIGEAAHPFPPTTIQGTAMAVEDGAVLAKLFSHLSSPTQIESFLYAFQEIRQARVRSVREAELGAIAMLTADGPAAAARDASLRANAAKGPGANVLEGGGSAESVWEEYSVLFGYDCEDEADEWWVQWGRLRQRAQDRSMAADGDEPA